MCKTDLLIHGEMKINLKTKHINFRFLKHKICSDETYTS